MRWAVERSDDYYKILQVDPAAHDDVIQAAYRRLALRYHPDRNSSPAAARMMVRLNEAYEVLGNPARRTEYDRRRRGPGEPPTRPTPPEPQEPKPVVRSNPRALFGRLFSRRNLQIALSLVAAAFIWQRPELLLVIFGMALSAAAFHFRLFTRNAVFGLMLIAAFLAVSAPYLGNVVYGAGLLFLNEVSDPATRGFWPDPAHMELGTTVVAEVDGQLRGFDTTTEAGRAGAIAAIKTESGARVMNFHAQAVFAGAALIAGLDTALRLAGLTSPPDPGSGPDRLRALGRSRRAWLIAVIAGVAAVIIGAAPQEFLDQVLEPGVSYSRGAGINSEVAYLFWPMLILDKVEALGYVAITLGILGWALGDPRRRLFATFDRGSAHQSAGRHSAALKKSGASLILAGIFGYWLDVFLLKHFLVPTAREIGIIVTGDLHFLQGQSGFPDWLEAVLTVSALWPLVVLLGIAVLVVGGRLRRTTPD